MVCGHLQPSKVVAINQRKRLKLKSYKNNK